MADTTLTHLAASSMFLAAAPAAASTRIEVGDVIERPQVLREGRLVRAVAIDTERASELIRDLKPILRPSQPRVVTQSVPAGAFIQRGSTVDLTLVRPANIRFEVLGEVHPALAPLHVGTVLAAIPPAVSTILAAKEDVATLTPTERTAVATFLDAQHVPTANATGAGSFEAVYSVLQDIQVFR